MNKIISSALKICARGAIVPIAALVIAQPASARAINQSLAVGCNWFPIPVSKTTANTGYPDVNASYFIAALPTAPTEDTTVVVEGPYAHVRYFSLETVSSFSIGDFVDELADYKMIPVENNQPSGLLPINPAAIPYSNNYQNHYKVTIKFKVPPLDPSKREPNVLYAGAIIPRATPPQLIFRRYLANPGYSNLDTAEMPTLTYVGPDGTIPLSQTPDTTACASIEKTLSGGEGSTLFLNPALPPPNPRFEPVFFSRLIPYPNMDSAYVETFTSLTYSPLLVVRVKVPVTPATVTATSGPAQVRYISFCHDTLHSTATVACMADYQMVPQADGYTNFVVSLPSQRPALATASAGYNWMPWTEADTREPGGLDLIREILPSHEFRDSYYKWAREWYIPGEKVLGDYFPESTYCDLETFNANAAYGGATLFDACKAAYAFHGPIKK